MTDLHGTPSDDLAGVLAAGETDVDTIFVSLSAKADDGRDAEYLEWHGLDHRPEQYRLAGLRHSQRLVSTPACRAARAASVERFDAVDHVMTYFFAGPAALAPFAALGAALGAGGRMPVRLPGVEVGVFDLAGRRASSQALVGADVVPWRPIRGVYLLLEQGSESPAALAEVPGVVGVWWHHGVEAPAPFESDHRGLQASYVYLDDDPVEVAGRLRGQLEDRWADTDAVPLLAAPFHEVVAFDWDRHLP